MVVVSDIVRNGIRKKAAALFLAVSLSLGTAGCGQANNPAETQSPGRIQDPDGTQDTGGIQNPGGIQDSGGIQNPGGTQDSGAYRIPAGHRTAAAAGTRAEPEILPEQAVLRQQEGTHQRTERMPREAAQEAAQPVCTSGTGWIRPI